MAALQGDLDCLIAGIPATDFVRLVRGHLPDILLKGADRIGFGFDSIEQIFKVIAPLALPPLVPRDRCFLYAGTLGSLDSAPAGPRPVGALGAA